MPKIMWESLMDDRDWKGQMIENRDGDEPYKKTLKKTVEKKIEQHI